MLRKLRELRHILTRRMWTPHPFAGPAIIQRCDVLRPAPGVVINPASAPSKSGRPAAQLATRHPNVSIPPAAAGRGRLSAFLRARIPWLHVVGGQG